MQEKPAAYAAATVTARIAPNVGKNARFKFSLSFPFLPGHPRANVAKSL
jgi:hypothetical protein